MSEIVCKLTEAEVSAIRDIYEKKLALENLAKIMSPGENNAMYERLIADYGATMRQFNEWWDTTVAAHQLPPDAYTVDFRDSQLIRPAKS